MNSPLVSVVIPSYNHGRYVGTAVRSVLHQSLIDLELIVVDDGSRDDSLAVLAGFEDPRMRVIAQKNHGAHAAINTGMAHAQGEFLTILNSDDVFHVDRLEALVSVLRNDTHIGLVGSHIEIIDDAGYVRGIKHGYADLPPWPLPQPSLGFRGSDDLRSTLATENYLATTSNYLFTRAAWKEHGPFRPLRYTHDWDFALRVIRNYDIALTPQPLMQYRIHDSNTIKETGALQAYELCWCTALHLPMLIRTTNTKTSRYLTRLLHSLHHHDAGAVLSTMLVQLSTYDAERRDEIALQLLDPENEQRRAYLEYLTMLRMNTTSHAHTSDLTRLRNFLAKALAAMKYYARRILPHS